MRRIHFALGFILAALLLVYWTTESKSVEVEHPAYLQMIEAATIMQEAGELIKDERLSREIEIDSETDVNETGWIGLSYSGITTTLGNLEAKRTSTNPNFAALVVYLLDELHLSEGDTVAVNFSSSFPAVNVAVLSALEAMDLQGVVFTSIGASSHGGNIPEWTYLDMESVIVDQGLVGNRTELFSLGGAKDLGTDMDSGVIEAIVSRMKDRGLEFYENSDFSLNVSHRYQKYTEGRTVKALINVGGNLVSFGTQGAITQVNGGIIKEIPDLGEGEGLAQMFLDEGIPVVHFLEIRDMAVSNGLPIDPVPLPQVGQGGVYNVRTYNKTLASITMGVLVLLGAGIWIWYRRDHWTKME